MPAEWTAEIIGKMHLHKIEKRALAKQLGMTPEYISMVLNGHREPVNAEKKFREAVDELIRVQKECQ